MKRIFKTRVFERWMQKVELSDALLLNAVDEMERGLIDADFLTITDEKLVNSIKSKNLLEISNEKS